MGMTREQRLAAGWIDRYAVRYDASGNPTWPVFDKVGNVRAEFDRAEAHERAAKFPIECRARLVVIWRRKRPAAPRQLKVGDEVVVRGRVNAIGDGTWIHVTVDGRGAGKSDYGFARTALERVKP